MGVMRRLGVWLALIALMGACGGDPDSPEPSVLSTWYEQTNDAVAEQGPPPDPVAARTWALAWWAADRSIAGRSDGPFVDAAVASAVHDVLVALVPSREDELDSAIDPDADPVGREAGRAAARAVLAERADDGLSDVEGPITVPPAAVGIWRPTPPRFQPAAQARVGDASPFLLRAANQFRPGPPPRPGTATYRRDLEETRQMGQDTSRARSTEQTAVATFWAGSELDIQVRLVREAMRASRVSTAQGSRLLSAFHRITADAEIAVFDAKYTYVNWRPITAIRVDGDGDPTTQQARDWTPFIRTPGHPEYPSGHTVYAGAAAVVLEHFLGSEPAGPLVFSSARSGGVARTFTTWEQAVSENEDARVWAGIHFRTSDSVGTDLGREVAEFGLGQLAD